jgi:uncharacterized membrane protein YgcG
MKTRDMLATIWLGLVIVAVTLGLVTVGVLFDNRQLRQDGRDLRVELDARSTETTGLRAERSSIEEELQAQRQRVEELSVELAELKLRADTNEKPVGQPAYRVRAYLENQWVSQGWLVPGRATTNSSGQLVYEPVVVLDPSARTALMAAAPREPAPTEPTSVTVNHNYPSAYQTVWPAFWVSTGGKPQHRPKPPESSTPFPTQPKPEPQPVSPFLSTRVWQPQTGFQRMAPGRPGGEWISSAPRGHSYISSGAGGGFSGGGGGGFSSGGGGGLSRGSGTGTFPARY